MPRLPRHLSRSPADWRDHSSYSMYPNPRSRFCISSFDVLLSSGRILFVSFSSMWITNSSIDSYPAASEHCLTFSSSSPSIFTLCEPNMISPVFICSAAVPAAVRRTSVARGVAGKMPALQFNRQRLARLKHRLPHYILRLRDSEFRQNRGCDVDQRRILRINLAVAQQHSRHLCEIHAMIAAPCIRVVLKHVRRKRTQNRFPSRAIPAVVADERVRTRARIRALIGFAREIDSRDHRRTILRIANLQKLLPDFPQPRVRLSGIPNSPPPPSPNIQIKAIKPQTVSARAAPIHIGEGLV